MVFIFLLLIASLLLSIQTGKICRRGSLVLSLMALALAIGLFFVHVKVVAGLNL
jgi:hypothetical protein